MRLQKTLPALALVALTASVPLFLSSGPTAQAAVTDDGEHSALHDAMETLKKGQRAVKKLMEDPAANEAELMRALQSMEGAVMTSIGETPEHPEGLAGKDLQQFYIGYRAELARLLEQVLALQSATLKGDAAALKAGYDAMVAVKKAGHTDYQLDD